MNLKQRTRGEQFPHLLTLGPRYAALAAEPFGSRPIEPWDGPPHRPGLIRIGFIPPCLVMGGGEGHQLTLARLLDPARFALVGTAVVDGGPVDDRMAEVHRALMPVRIGLDAARSLAAASDVLVTWAVADLPGLLAGLAHPPRVIAVVHSPIEQAWGQVVYARPDGIDRFVAVSDLARQAIPESSRSVPTTTINNCVDPSRMAVNRDRAAMRRAWDVPRNVPVAGYLGRLAEEKDPLAMVRLAASLPEPWHVVVVGSGELAGALAAAKTDGGLDRLHLVGPDPRAGDVVGGFDVLVVPSRYESFGLTMAEGLWAGVPVVAPPVGIAKLHPGLTRAIPIGADGPTLAAAVLAAYASGSMPGATAWAHRELGAERFGREWSDLLIELAGERTRRADPLRLAMLAEVCPHGSGPCGCGTEPRNCSRPDRPREVRRADCLACVASPA